MESEPDVVEKSTSYKENGTSVSFEKLVF